MGRFAYRTVGYSLLEVIIVLLVLAIAAAMVVPTMGSASGTKLRQAARLLAGDLGYARSASIAHGDDPRVVVFKPEKNRYHIAAQSKPAEPIARPETTQPLAVTFGSGRAAELDGVTIESISLDDGGDTTLGFGIYGSPDVEQQAKITLAHQGQTITITVHPTTGQATLGDLQ
jgi:general secretion pathway protein H